MSEEHLVTVFADGAGGGNPAPVVVDADDWPDARRQELARRWGHESAFVVRGAEGCDFGLRFWVPRHEMSMCVHATVGATWLLHELGRLPAGTASVDTPSGVVRARLRPGGAEVSQPRGRVTPLSESDAAAVLEVLGLTPGQVEPAGIANAVTSRVKTVVPVRDTAVLDALTPRWAAIEAVCDRVDSTGLYPYAMVDPGGPTVAARQFPRASGYAEDPATGVAAAALAFALLATGAVATDGPPVTVLQGRAMGHPSRMAVRFEPDGSGCWVGGSVTRGGG